jgi:transcriptional regulator GlxA family with amidase domain
MAPTRFLHALRLEKARQLLVETDRSVGEIAVGAGYHDQSHFTRHFRKLTGMAPGKYRAEFRR